MHNKEHLMLNFCLLNCYYVVYMTLFLNNAKSIHNSMLNCYHVAKNSKATTMNSQNKWKKSKNIEYM